jgi:transcription antitermination factor NusA-like protein
MKTPICDLCARTSALCSGCEEKLKGGKISDMDVTVSRLLHKLGETYNLSAADFYKAIDLERVVLILTHGDVGILIGREGKVVAEISNAVGKKVRIAEVSGDMRKTVSDIVMPARVLGINKIYRDGKEAYKVRFAKSELKQLPMDMGTLEKAMKQLFEADVVVAFE